MKLFHGTYEKTVPIIKLGEFVMSGNNVFDGLFSSPERDIAASHGNPVFIYHVDARFQEVYAFLHNELDTADVEEIADRVMWDNNSDIEDFADILSPRLGSDCSILVCLYANSFGFIYAQRSQQFIWYF
ncbi:hypothetical protein [Escherichia coli]|uniref:hypothetical protein n=1 Tax=Escherichia coli TaxID=562 RepID=UPI0008FEF94A|nr:hypothetical protein [Escherichia coli]